MKKHRYFLLLLCLAVFLTACGHPGKSASEADDKSSETAYGYSVQISPLPENMILSTDQCADAEKLYLCGLDSQDKPVMSVYSEGSFSPVALPEGISYIQACCITEGGAAILAGDYPFTWENAEKLQLQNETDRFLYTLFLFDAEGRLQSEIPLPEEACGGTNWDSLLWDSGFFYLMSSTDFLQLSRAGALMNGVHLEGGCFISQTLTENGVAVSLFDSSADGGDDTVKIKLLLNPEQFAFEPVYTDEQLTLLGMGRDRQGNILVNLGPHILSLDAQYHESAELFNFDAAGMLNTSFPKIYPSPDGYLLASPNAKRLTQLVYGELPKKEELLLWLSWSDAAVSEWVEGFNLTNTQYSVTVEHVDLSDEQGKDAVRAKIIAGDTPDLYFTGGESGFASLRGSAAFENLFPYLDSSAIGRDGLLPAVIDAASEEGGLYTMPIDFSLLTMSEQTGLLPQKDMSIADMLSLPDVQNGSLSVFPSDMSRENLWYWLSSLYLYGNLDEETGTCSFETQEYSELLAACGSARSANTQDTVPSIFSFQQIPGIRRLVYLQSQYGDDIALFAGLGTAYSMEHSFAISNTSARKEGAWQFIEYALSADLSKQEFSWPVTADKMDKLIENACSVGIANIDAGGNCTLSPSNAELLRQFFDQSSGAGMSGTHPELIRIMKEEAEKYFAGDRSAEEAAAMTQSRAQLYLAERYG